MPTTIEHEAAIARIEELQRRAHAARRAREPARRNGSRRPSPRLPRTALAGAARRLKLA
jgi:hypothetical protein